MDAITLTCAVFAMYVVGCLMGTVNVVALKRKTWSPSAGATIQVLVGLTLSVLMGLFLV